MADLTVLVVVTAVIATMPEYPFARRASTPRRADYSARAGTPNGPAGFDQRVGSGELKRYVAVRSAFARRLGSLPRHHVPGRRLVRPLGPLSNEHAR
jgi:hypothetical protein